MGSGVTDQSLKPAPLLTFRTIVESRTQKRHPHPGQDSRPLLICSNIKMATFHSFYWLSSIPSCVCVCVCVYTYIIYILSIYTPYIYIPHIYLCGVYTHHIFFIHSSTDTVLGCFLILAIVNNAAMNTRCIYLFKETETILAPFAREETEAQRYEMIFPRFYSCSETKLK